MKTLLLVIDLQVGWRHKTATEPAMLKTVELCKAFNGEQIHCCFRNDPASLFYTQLHWQRFSDNHDTEQIPEIAQRGLRQYWRSTYSCLTEEVLAVTRQFDHVYIAGVFTDISVAMTAMDLFDHNIPVSVVADCVATLHGESVHHAALRSLEHALGSDHIVKAEEVLHA